MESELKLKHPPKRVTRRPASKEYKLELVDYIIGAMFAVVWWWDSIFNRCPDSPDGHHFFVVKDAKYQCRYCPKLQERQEPGG